jgi:PKD domain-containing protein
MWRRSLVIQVTLAAAVAGGCGQSTGLALGPDAHVAQDGAPIADAAARDGLPPLTWVDFAASGCEQFVASGPTCSGAAPLDLRFVAVAPTPIDTYVWSFGDGSSFSTQPFPSHRFDAPGSYTVRLTVGAASGTAQVKKDRFVVVTPAPIGSTCTSFSQCEAGLSCVCGPGDSCPPALTGGMCTRGCAAGSSCPGGAVCADLAPTGASGSWQRALCLAACTGDADCGRGFVCRELLAGDRPGWVKGCFAADLLADEGASCEDVNGTPDDARCASGRCAALGARGVCGGACGSRACPSYAACAQLGTLGSICLLRCTAARPCTSDPWLDCEAPNPSGSLGFTVTDNPVAQYCAPARCTSAATCGLDGACTAGFCGPN